MGILNSDDQLWKNGSKRTVWGIELTGAYLIVSMYLSHQAFMHDKEEQLGVQPLIYVDGSNQIFYETSA